MQVERHIETARIGCPSVGLSGRLHITQSLHGFARLYTPHCVREAVESPLQHMRILAVFRHGWMSADIVGMQALPGSIPPGVLLKQTCIPGTAHATAISNTIWQSCYAHGLQAIAMQTVDHA